MKSTVLLAAASLSLLSSCRIMDRLLDPHPGFQAGDKRAVVPREFLFTRSPSLTAWLDQVVVVQIEGVPLTQVFNHESLRGFSYKFLRLPPRSHVVSMHKIAMTRRQILWSLSHDYQLQMTPRYGPNGEILWVDIRSQEEALVVNKR